jgi:hypothetical protein
MVPWFEKPLLAADEEPSLAGLEVEQSSSSSFAVARTA